MNKKAIAVAETDVASGMHMPASTAFSISNDIALAKDRQKRKRRKKKVKSFLHSILVKKSTGLTSVPMPLMLNESYHPDGGLGEQGVVLSFTGSTPGMVPPKEEDFISFFGREGFGQDHLPPKNYFLNKKEDGKIKKRKKRKSKLHTLLNSLKKSKI